MFRIGFIIAISNTQVIDIMHLDKQLLNIKATFYWKYTSYEADEGDQDFLNERTLAPAPSVTVAPLLNLGRPCQPWIKALWGDSLGEDHTASLKWATPVVKGRWEQRVVRAFPGRSVRNVAVWSLKISTHTLFGRAFMPSGVSWSPFENPSSAPWMASPPLAWAGVTNVVQGALDPFHSIRHTTSHSSSHKTQRYSEQRVVPTYIPAHCSLPALPFSPLCFPQDPISAPPPSSLPLPPSLLSHSLLRHSLLLVSCSSVSFSLPVFFLLEIIITELSLDVICIKPLQSGEEWRFFMGLGASLWQMELVLEKTNC